MEKTFKIRIKGTNSYSHGIIQKYHWSDVVECKWSKKGKEWKTEKSVKDHIRKYLVGGGDVSNWEIVTLEYMPTKPIADWLDASMTLAVLKKQ